MVTDKSSPAALTLPLPAHAHAAARDLARVHRVSLRAVLLAASMYAGQGAGHDGRRPLDKGRLVRDAETFLSRAGTGSGRGHGHSHDRGGRGAGLGAGAADVAAAADVGAGTGTGARASQYLRYTSDSGDILIRVAEDPEQHSFRVELIPLSARIPPDRQWRVWNRLVTFLQAPPSDLTACARTLATRSPEAVAIEDDHDRFTYGDLVQLADAAVGLGAPGSVVGVLGSASARFWATVFALYDAGLTYVPLDARLPARRLEFMVRTAGCELIVDTGGGSGRAGSTRSARSVCSALAPVVGWKQLNDLPPAKPDVAARRTDNAPDQVAYITFTAGSTGTPKGVQVPRRALAHLATWAASELDLVGGTVVSQAAAVGFDASAWEVWPALLAGARVQVVPDDVRVDPGEFVAWLLAHHVEVAFAPTPIAELLIGAPWPAGGVDLRVLGSGGDRLHPIPPGLPFRVLNLYGSAECTAVSAAAWVEPGDGMPPIGHVLPHLYHRIVDDHGALVPPGGEGELWLGGPGLALGYAGLPNETAERFIPDPHATTAQCVHRTGDIVRERPDGQLEYLGRRTQQLKIAGTRVDHGELEAALRRIPGVRSAVSTVDDRSGTRHLVLHVVPDGTVPQPRIAAEAVSSLPTHLRSTRITFADELPLTINGTVDGSGLRV